MSDLTETGIRGGSENHIYLYYFQCFRNNNNNNKATRGSMVTNYLTLNKIEDTKGFVIWAHNCDELQMLLVHQEVFFKNIINHL